MLKGHGGNVQDLARVLNCRVTEITDMSSNLNPQGPPEGLKEHLENNLDRILALPEVDSGEICSLFAAKYNLHSTNVLAGNGTTQFIYEIPKILKSKKVLIVAPTYSDYADSCKMNGVDFDYLFLEKDKNFVFDTDEFQKRLTSFDTAIICNPNNPTGGLIDKSKIKSLLSENPEVNFVIDESYLPFVGGMDKLSLSGELNDNLIVLNSMSKIFRVPGLRIGFVISSELIIDKFREYMLPWSVNGLATSAVEFLMSDPGIEDFEDISRIFFKEELAQFKKSFDEIEGLKLFPTDTFFLIAETSGFKGYELCEFLKKRKILIRDCANFKGLGENFVRFSLKRRETNQKLVDEIKNFLKDR